MESWHFWLCWLERTPTAHWRLGSNSNHPNSPKRSCIRTLSKGAQKDQEMKKKTLFKMSEKNGYPRDFVRRTVRAINKETNRMVQLNRRIILQCTKNISKLTARFLQPQGITAGHRPSRTLGRHVWKSKEYLNRRKEQTWFTKSTA